MYTKQFFGGSMKRLFVVLFLISALGMPLPSIQAQRRKPKATTPAAGAQRGVEQITAAQMRAFLTFIASDEMEGRDTPSRGLDTTAKFIAMNLTRWGFKPAGDEGSFLQHIALRRDRLDAENTRAELNGQRLVLGEDYIPATNAGSASGQLVFVGSGWLIKSKNVDAYKGIDAKGKIAIIASSNTMPGGARIGEDLGKRGEDWMNPIEYARRQGVAGIVYFPSPQFLANWDRNRQRIMERTPVIPEKFLSQSGGSIPSITISSKTADAILQGETGEQTGNRDAAAISAAMTGGGAIPSFALKPEKKLSFNVAAKNETLSTQNVVAVWEGSDPILKNEYVALGAHYDHVGLAATPVKGDAVYNGADDDGSGTTALLAMAEALAHAAARPKRSVLFVWHCGEEKGLWGSRYFTDNPTIPLGQIITQLNIDMIGRSKKEGDTNVRNRNLTGPNEIYVIGHRMMSTELGDLSEAVNKRYLNLGYDYRYDDPKDPNRFFYRSDHYNYARKGIPIIFFFDGVHEDYHQLGDEVQKIDFQKMEKVTRTIYLTLWELGNRATRPKVDKGLPAQVSGG